MTETNNPNVTGLSEEPGTDGQSEPVEKKKKAKYSRGLKGVQRMEKGVTKAQRRLAKAVYQGLSTWAEKRDKSSRKRKDGALRDAMKNSAKAFEASAKVAARAPRDLLSSVTPLKPRRMIRLLFPFA